MCVPDEFESFECAVCATAIIISFHSFTVPPHRNLYNLHTVSLFSIGIIVSAVVIIVIVIIGTGRFGGIKRGRDGGMSASMPRKNVLPFSFLGEIIMSGRHQKVVRL